MKQIGKLESIAFVTGFALLTFELVAARLLAPSIGSSTYVWTSVIGVIIAALSFGYYAGGRLADARNASSDVVLLLLTSAGAVAGTLLFSGNVLEWAVDMGSDARWQAVVAATVLFAPASFLLGAISPYLAKLNVRSLHTSGRAVASLSACNSIGGIAGTFITGFILFGYVGSRETLSIVIVILVLCSWLLVPKWRLGQRLLGAAILLIIAIPSAPDASQGIVYDTPSATYTVHDYFLDGRLAHGLTMGPHGVQSIAYASGTHELFFWYTKELAARTIEHHPTRVLMLGGGAFTIPQYLADKLPDTQIDVVEIDPALESISKNHFNFAQPKNVHLIFDDARRYVNQSQAKYDVILVDVYGDTAIPFALTTREFGQQLARLLKPDGLVAVNLVAGETGACKPAFDAMISAYWQPGWDALYQRDPSDIPERANYIVLYGSSLPELKKYTMLARPKQAAYSDNFAPTDRLYFDCEQVSS